MCLEEEPAPHFENAGSSVSTFRADFSVAGRERRNMLFRKARLDGMESVVRRPWRCGDVRSERTPPQNRNVVSDPVIRLTGAGALDKCPQLLRRVEVAREDTGSRGCCVPDEPAHSGGQHHRCDLQGPLAD